MERRALIIGHPGKDEPDRTGVRINVREYCAFLMHEHGGFWYSEEIERLIRPDTADVLNAVQRLKGADYSLVVFAGHGDQVNRDTFIGLEDGTLDSDSLRTGKKQTIILDCCRVERTPEISEDVLLKSLAKAAVNRNGVLCRVMYDVEIERCTKLAIKAYACSPGEEAAGSSSTGGYYSNHLMTAGSDWAKAQGPNALQVMSIMAAHEKARSVVRQRTAYAQNPQIDSGRSGEPYFPFAVVG